MSTYLYLQCEDHMPCLVSEREVGQHMYDLPGIGKFLITGKHVEPWSKYFFEAAKSFKDQHPHCKISILSETGEVYNVIHSHVRTGSNTGLTDY